MILASLKIVLVVFWTVAMSIGALLGIPFNRGGKLFNWISVRWARGVLRICGVKVVAEGVENLDFSTNYIYVANHASMFDIPAVLGYIPDQIRMVVKKELERVPFFGWAVSSGGYIFIDRKHSPGAMRSLEKAVESIRKGSSVVLFAEGTRTRTGKLQPFKRGAFNLAVRSRVPVVPLTINGSYKILPKSSFRINPGTIRLKISKPIPTNGSEGKEMELKLLDQVQAVIQQHYIDQ